ncbi:MAG: hypothetical protein HY741_05430 [Chloroflexi bacterium]|nr:hypothetical protein [Chloroflexota bacterium]
MELEARVAELEKEVKELKTEIRQTLVEIAATLPEKPAPPRNWNRAAWFLALVNLLMAVVLLGNASLVAPVQQALALSPVVLTWLRALWLVIAFVWLLLQLYPLALLLMQEEREWRKVSWQNALKVVRARPGLLLVLTCLVLLSALINTVMPAAWLLVTLALLVAVAGLALRAVLDLRTKSF